MLDERSWFVERREETQDERADAIFVVSLECFKKHSAGEFSYRVSIS